MTAKLDGPRKEHSNGLCFYSFHPKITMLDPKTKSRPVGILLTAPGGLFIIWSPRLTPSD